MNIIHLLNLFIMPWKQMNKITHLNPVTTEKTEESLADKARELLEKTIKDGMLGIIFIIETQEGWHHTSIPVSTFFAYGGIDLTHRGLKNLMKDIISE